jgi:hypothetical protein
VRLAFGLGAGFGQPPSPPDSFTPEESAAAPALQAATRPPATPPAGVSRWANQHGKISLGGFSYTVGAIYAGEPVEPVEVVAAGGLVDIRHAGVVVATHAQRLRPDQADRTPRARGGPPRPGRHRRVDGDPAGRRRRHGQLRRHRLPRRPPMGAHRHRGVHRRRVGAAVQRRQDHPASTRSATTAPANSAPSPTPTAAPAATTPPPATPPAPPPALSPNYRNPRRRRVPELDRCSHVVILPNDLAQYPHGQKNLVGRIPTRTIG